MMAEHDAQARAFRFAPGEAGVTRRTSARLNLLGVSLEVVPLLG